MEKERTVSAFEHENALMHYGRVNRRSLIALVCVCVTFIVITTIFVVAYTVREQHWIDALTALRTRTEVAADDGVHKLPDP